MLMVCFFLQGVNLHVCMMFVDLTTVGNTCLVDWVKQGGAIGTEATLLGKLGGLIPSTELLIVSVGSDSC